MNDIVHSYDPFLRRTVQQDEYDRVRKDTRKRKNEEEDILVLMKPSDLAQIKEMIKYCLLSDKPHYTTKIEALDLKERLEYV